MMNENGHGRGELGWLGRNLGPVSRLEPGEGKKEKHKYKSCKEKPTGDKESCRCSSYWKMSGKRNVVSDFCEQTRDDRYDYTECSEHGPVDRHSKTSSGGASTQHARCSTTSRRRASTWQRTNASSTR